MRGNYSAFGGWAVGSGFNDHLTLILNEYLLGLFKRRTALKVIFKCL